MPISKLKNKFLIETLVKKMSYLQLILTLLLSLLASPAYSSAAINENCYALEPLNFPEPSYFSNFKNDHICIAKINSNKIVIAYFYPRYLQPIICQELKEVLTNTKSEFSAIANDSLNNLFKLTLIGRYGKVYIGDNQWSYSPVNIKKTSSMLEQTKNSDLCL